MAIIENIDMRRSPLVTLSGEVNQRGSRPMKDVLSEVFESDGASPRVDLTGVHAMDSEGLSAFLHWCREFHDNDRGFEVVSINSVIRSLFESEGHGEIVIQSEERAIPPIADRQPITDCFAAAGDWEIRSFSVAAKLESCKIVRDRVVNMMANLPFSIEERADTKMAVGEAASNAIRHGCRERDWETVTVRCLADSHKLVVEISDPGAGFDPDAVPTPLGENGLAEGGMGIVCMRKCVDEVSFEFVAGTTVRLVKLVKS